MKKIYRPLLKGSNWILTVLLGLLGITVVACGEDEYGSPYAEYAVKGKVTNTNGHPIPNIVIHPRTAYSSLMPTKTSPMEPIRSDQEGNYTIKVTTGGESDFMIYAIDADGAHNGLYQPDSILVKGSEVELTGGDKHWFMGRGEATANFTLKEEKPLEGT